MLTLNRLRVRGFRGFVGGQEFLFDAPVTLLFGPNRCGKSSILNAIEWGLFGSEAVGSHTGIRERIDWVVANRLVKPADVLVELTLGASDGEYIVRRSLPRRTGRKTTLELILPDGEVLAGEEAEQRLARLTGASFRDFATTVYQHQETIRAVLTQEPRERNDAIDRLLGLSDYQNLLAALHEVNPRGRQRDMEKLLEAFDRDVQAAFDARANDLERLRQQAEAAGVPRDQLNPRAALILAGSVRQALADFATQLGLAPPILPPPADAAELTGFEKAARAEIARLRRQMPGAAEQQELFALRGRLTELLAELERAHQERDAVGRDIRELDRQYSGQQAVEAQIARLARTVEEEQARQTQADARAALIDRALDLLQAEAAEDRPADACPVCGHESPGLAERLRREWEEKFQGPLRESKERVRSLQEQIQKLRAVAEIYRKSNDRLQAVEGEFARCRRKASELLGREISEREDVWALAAAEGERIGQRLQQLEEAVAARQDRLGEIEQILERLRRIADLVALEDKQRGLERMQQSPEYRELEAARGRLAELLGDLEALREAVSAAAGEEARTRLTAAEAAIDQYFRRMTGHPAVRAIRLKLTTDKRSGRNSYEVADQNGNDLTPLLSQGDLNALALAIFLGLAAAGSGAFGFVLLDDPSQSLDAEHKRQLVKVLDEVAQHKQVVLATMDQEFRHHLTEGLTVVRREYRCEKWTPEKGPTITRV
ncbi:MAG TPA: AAA family ATPase [Gemmataceae bacterium]|nr:AAA family ATPase [Gemmataceae bacterium]